MENAALMTDSELLSFLNSSLARAANPTMTLLRGSLLCYDRASRTLTCEFQTSQTLSNGNGMVQGGFSAAMADACAAYVWMMDSKLKSTISTLEQKQSYFKRVPIDEKIWAKARIVKSGKSVGFFEVDLVDPASGEVLMNASQTSMFVELKTRKQKQEEEPTLKTKL